MTTLRERASSAPRAPRVRRRAETGLRPWQPFALTLLVAGLLAGGWFVYERWCANHLSLQFSRGAGPVPPLELTFFPDQLAFAAPSPPPALGELRLDGAARTVVGDDLVPGHALVRYRGDGVGAGFAFVELGKPVPAIELRSPATLSGRVGEPIGFWCYGWRCAGYRPIADAEVSVMGGGEHGVDLVTTRTDRDGRFVLTGFDGELDALGLRVRAEGYTLAHQRIEGLVDHAGEQALVALARAPLRRGRLLCPPGLDPTTLRVLARGLPGVEATPSADGTFALDHVPTEVEARLVLHGLPELFAHAPARTARERIVDVDVVPGAIVRGRVLDGTDWRPLPGALVWIGDRDAVRTDERGEYELTRVLPGEVVIAAQWQPPRTNRRRAPRHGARTLELTPGKIHDGVDITIDP